MNAARSALGHGFCLLDGVIRPESPPTSDGVLDPRTRAFYHMALSALAESGIPFLIGGAYAFERYAGIARHTKDIDVFVRPDDADRVLTLLRGTGCRTEVSFTHWLGKAHCGDDYVDVIFSSGNGLAEVDEEWFEHAVDDVVLGLPVKLAPAEEMIWQKSMIMERERFDGADIAHILRARGKQIDWRRLVRRFGPHWRVLLAHLVLFGFIYPSERDQVPAPVIELLLRRLHRELSQPQPQDAVCQGTLLSRAQYLVDIEEWGYTDARLAPRGEMTADEIEEWTAGIDDTK